jgi:glycosyltransferase involved in cell wall biosynthesis
MSPPAHALLDLGCSVTQSERPQIWVLVDTYLPGYRGGGPIQSIANLVDALGEEFDFRIVTSQRDHGSTVSYPDVPGDCWTPVGKALVNYLPTGYKAIPAMLRLLRQASPRIVYLNSLFSRSYSIFPVILAWLSVIDVGSILLAPRGELSEGALRIKNWRKKLFLSTARSIGLYRRVWWHAVTEYEMDNIYQHFFRAKARSGRSAPVLTARCLVEPTLGLVTLSSRRAKPAGQLRLVFLSRICRIKNLQGALKLLHSLEGQILFTIYGPIEDSHYWSECKSMISTLPRNIRVQYSGEIPHEGVNRALQPHDVFFLPTLGEGFCRVILEALQAGCPVITSDQSPWRNPEAAGAGWNIPLVSTARFQQVLQACIDMPPCDFRDLSRRAFEFADKMVRDSQWLQENRSLLLTAGGKLS